MAWVVKITGDMTLAITEGKRIVVRVNMLGQKTMEAGNNGERLCRAINDLSAIADFFNETEIKLPHPECGLSPLPWHIKQAKNSFSVCDSLSKTICFQTIASTNSIQVKYFDEIKTVIRNINKCIEIQK